MTLAALIRKSESGKVAPQMTPKEEARIRTWCAQIGERDPDLIAEVLALCRRDADAQSYYLGRAAEMDAYFEGRGPDRGKGQICQDPGAN